MDKKVESRYWLGTCGLIAAYVLFLAFVFWGNTIVLITSVVVGAVSYFLVHKYMDEWERMKNEQKG